MSYLHETGGYPVRWGWLLALGILVILLGFAALAATFLTTMISVGVLGVFLALGGVALIVHAFFETRGHSGFWMSLLLGVLYAVAGYYLFVQPAIGAIILTMFMAAFFLAGGLLRAITAISLRFAHWGWFFASGLISVLLGLLIWMQWPFSGLYIIGLFVGIDLLLLGTTLVSLAFQSRTPHARPM